jgi:hypothetical protein
LSYLNEHPVNLQVKANELAQFKQGLEFAVPIHKDLLLEAILSSADRFSPVALTPVLERILSL